MVKVESNLTKGVRATLMKLIRNEDLVICKADNGDITVIMAKSQCLDLAYRQLRDKGNYQLLVTNPTQETAKKFNSYLDTCLGKGLITKLQYRKLYIYYWV